MFCSILLRKSPEENSVSLGQEKLTQKNDIRNQIRRYSSQLHRKPHSGLLLNCIIISSWCCYCFIHKHLDLCLYQQLLEGTG